MISGTYWCSRPISVFGYQPSQRPRYGCPVHAKVSCNTVGVHSQLAKVYGLLSYFLISRRFGDDGKAYLERHLSLGSNALRPCPPFSTGFIPHTAQPIGGS